MVVALQQGNYIIESIVSETDDVAIYTARDRRSGRFIISEVRSIDLINRYLPQLKELMTQGRLVCVTENSYLYIITHYYDGDNAAIYFKVKRPPLIGKLEMIRQAAFIMIGCSDFPEVIRQSMLQPESLCVYRGEMCVNCYFSPYERRDVFTLFYEETRNFFTADEIQKYSYIGIVLQKLKNGIYTDFTQVYADIGQLIAKCGKSGAIISGIKAFYEKIKAPLKIMAAAAAVIIAAAALYYSLTESSKNGTESVYYPIDHIGTVKIDSGDTGLRDIHVGSAED